MVQITVIIPCYNIARYISRCIDSMIDQECKPLEIILVDDGSSDNLREVLDPYIVKDSICYIRQENQGVSAARNLGLNHAKGDYIYFCDGDDYVDPFLFKVLASALQKHRYDVLMFGFNRYEINENGDWVFKGTECLPAGEYHDNRIIIEELLPQFMGSRQEDLDRTVSQDIMHDHAASCVWRMLYKKSFLEENHIRFDTRLALGEDRLFITKALLYANSVLNIDAPLYNYLFRNAGSSGSMISAKNKFLYLNRTDWIRSYSELRDEVLDKKELDIFSYYSITCLLEIQPVITSLAHHPLVKAVPLLHKFLTLRDVRLALRSVDLSRCSRYYRVMFTIFRYHLSYLVLFYRRVCCLIGRL